MFLKCHPRIKDSKEHRYWSVVENRRCGRDKFVQRQVLYLGEINDSQRESWCRTIEVFDEKRERTLPLVSRGSAAPEFRRRFWRASPAQRDGTASAPAMGSLLAGLRALRTVGVG